MQTDPTLYTKSMMAQMRSLIIHSFRKLSESIEHTPTVIIDGLDECDGHKMHQLILEIIYEVDAMHKLPPRFLITSCPDSQSHTFARRLTTQHSALSPSALSSTNLLIQIKTSIKKYLSDGFEGIYKRTLSNLLGLPLPN